MSESYSLVLVGRYPGKDRAVAQALAREFGRDDAWALQVVGASPIVMLDNLTHEQANAVHAALGEVEAAGSLFQVQHEVEEGTAKIQWPAAPRIRGRLIADFLNPGVALTTAGGAAAGKNAVTLIVPCPYTNQKMKLMISVSVTKATEGATGMLGAPQVNIAAAAAPVQQPPVMVPASRPPSRATAVVPPALVATNTPVAQPAVRPPVPVPMVQQRQAAPPQQINANAPNIIGLESLEELEPMEQFPAPAEQRAAPRSPQRGSVAPPRSPATGVPLPDVPVLHNQAPQPPRPIALPEVPQAVPVPAQVTAPMDLEVFEQKVSSSGIFRAPAVTEEAVEEAVPLDENGALCSVFMGKSNSPKVHQLYAEMTGVSVQEAQRACQKAIVAIAKDISEPDAHDIKARFAAINVQVRITKKK
ncbi:MAG TPA: hypothetical protein VEJ63_20180 [Planctomycetota bacterium]|nr:hypothetical protein [Planctomycetota bacterium]